MEMIRITYKDYVIKADGHAENSIVCAMYTAMTVALLQNLNNRLNQNLPFVLEDGHFKLDTYGCSAEARQLITSYLYAIRQLAISYPNSFDIAYDYSYTFDN